jgi:transposase
MRRRSAWRDDQGERIEGLLPGREGPGGVTAQDNRLFVEAVLSRYRAGIPWRDLPERLGPWKAVPTRFSRWAAGGVWKEVFQSLAGDADHEYALIDRTLVRAHQPRAGAPKKRVRTKPSAAAKAGCARKFMPPLMPWVIRRDSC